jgi:hypothetical protein
LGSVGNDKGDEGIAAYHKYRSNSELSNAAQAKNTKTGVIGNGVRSRESEM